MIKLIFLTALSWSNPNLPADSLRMETINGKLFIIHQVGEHETLYGISKRYGTPIASILEFNPKADAGLDIGQILRILYVPRSKEQTSDGIVHKVLPKETLFSISKLYDVSIDDIKAWNNLRDNSLSTGQSLVIKKKQQSVNPSKGEEEEAKSTPGRHTVAAKETLFLISRKYGVTVQQLKDWNAIQGDEVKMGDIVWVVQPPRSNEKEPVKLAEIKPVTQESVKPPITKESTVTVSESVRGTDEVKEGGLAELIEGTEGNRKYLALHRTARVGTIMKVRNELNNREVFVRVVGPIPDTGVNDKIVIKISKSAYDRLGAIDPKFRAEVTYYK
jgi:LysM repeat protein